MRSLKTDKVFTKVQKFWMPKYANICVARKCLIDYICKQLKSLRL